MLKLKLPDNFKKNIEKHKNDVERFIKGEMSFNVFKAARVPRGIYEQRKDGTYMIRIRVPAGKLNIDQIEMLCKLSETYSNTTLHVTTRQDVQLHNIKIEDTPFIMEELYKVNLTSFGGGGNTVRNICACPYAGFCEYEKFDVTPFVYSTTEYLINLKGSYNLPRKYKISFSGCNADCAYAKVNDLGFIAKIKDGKLGFSVYAGGGMGNQSRIGDLIYEWLPSKDVIKVAETIRQIFDKLGDRHNRAKARLRFVFEKIGVAEFKKLLDKEIINAEKYNLNDISTKPLENYIDGLSVISQKQSEYVAVPINLPLGDININDLLILKDISKKYSSEKSICTTQDQNLIIPFINIKDVSIVKNELKKLSIDVINFDTSSLFTACTGSSTCKLGMCLSRNLSLACSNKLKELDSFDSILQNINIKISGCPNSCGQHLLGDIGFYGSAKRQDSYLIPTYNVTIKNSSNYGEKIGTLAAKYIPDFLLSLIKDFKMNRNENESFINYTKRKEISYFENTLNRVSNIPSFKENPDFYKDWGSNDYFSLKGRGAGECGAGVFEVITEDINHAKKYFKENKLNKAKESACRSLLITKGIDTQNTEEIFKMFDKYFIQTDLVSKDLDIESLINRIDFLFSKLDSNLKFNIETEKIEHETISNDKQIVEYDLSGVACPMNFVKAKLKMESMNINDELIIILDDGAPIENVPGSFKAEGQTIKTQTQLENGQWKVKIIKNL